MADQRADRNYPRSLQGDLYSAHFLVRKAQGGSRYLDWLHAILHKLEGDFRNAKMWYTDMGNNNRGALDSLSSAADKESAPPKFVRFHQFWFLPSANGGAGERASAQSVVLDSPADTPRELSLTAHQHTDLVFLASLSASSATKVESIQRNIQKHFRATTKAEDKIRESSSAFSFDELEYLRGRIDTQDLKRDLIGSLTKVELAWLLTRMVEDFGWRSHTAAEAVDALRLESTSAQAESGTERKGKATNMVLDPATGSRRF
jgi:hypothetical protein